MDHKIILVTNKISIGLGKTYLPIKKYKLKTNNK